MYEEVPSYLIEDGSVVAFRRRADRLADRQDGVRVLITGPWPPYSFAAERR